MIIAVAIMIGYFVLMLDLPSFNYFLTISFESPSVEIAFIIVAVIDVVEIFLH